MKCFGKTHPGKVRDHNEDAIGWENNLSVMVLADGMGGHASGEVASDICRTTILQRVADGELITNAILQAHQDVVKAASLDHSRSGMGSTVVVARAREGNYEIAWVGDSRAYLWRDNHLTQLTRDHSYLEWLISNGQISEDEARSHPQRNIVTQSIGLGDPKPDIVRGRLQSNDRILLCSDGLTDELTDDEIAVLCNQNEDTAALVDKLVDAALAKEGRDNISVLVAEFDAELDASAADATVEFEIRHKPWLSILLGVGAAVFLALFAMLFFN